MIVVLRPAAPEPMYDCSRTATSAGRGRDPSSAEPPQSVDDDEGDIVAELLRDEHAEPAVATGVEERPDAARDRARRRQLRRLEVGQAAQRVLAVELEGGERR